MSSGFGVREMKSICPPSTSFGSEHQKSEWRAATVLLLLINDASSYWYGQSDSFQALVSHSRTFFLRFPFFLSFSLSTVCPLPSPAFGQHEKWISFFSYNVTSRKEDSERINKRNDWKWSS